jgi:hypothetical protein
MRRAGPGPRQRVTVTDCDAQAGAGVAETGHGDRLRRQDRAGVAQLVIVTSKLALLPVARRPEMQDDAARQPARR